MGGCCVDIQIGIVDGVGDLGDAVLGVGSDYGGEVGYVLG